MYNDGEHNTTRSITNIIDNAGELTPESSIDDVEEWLGSLRMEASDCGPGRRELVREAAKDRLRLVEKIDRPAGLLDTYLDTREAEAGERPWLSGREVRFEEPDPHPEAVSGDELLGDLSGWLGSYVWMSQEAADAAAVWAVATWFVEDFYFAPVLAVLSPTKQCGKTRMLDLLDRIVRRGRRTSGVGVTEAVVFRLNDKYRPTLLIDEAEKLSSAHHSRNLISLLNEGYRKGGSVARCAGGDQDFEVRTYDAFGFRALAAIGGLWDTLLDRAIVINLDRKPADIDVRRFADRVVAEEGRGLSARIARWREDNREVVVTEEEEAPRPQWLSDRACDYWAPLFAIGTVAGGSWLDRLKEAARRLEASAREDDAPSEQLIRDIQQVFENKGWPEGIKSGTLVRELNQIETSPWGDRRGGNGLSAHKLASLLKPFGIAPDQQRNSEGTKIRGYWWSDLEDVCRRYGRDRSPNRESNELGQQGQSRNNGKPDRPSSERNSGIDRRMPPSADSSSHSSSQSETPETAGTDRNVPDVPDSEHRLKEPEVSPYASEVSSDDPSDVAVSTTDSDLPF